MQLLSCITLDTTKTLVGLGFLIVMFTIAWLWLLLTEKTDKHTTADIAVATQAPATPVAPVANKKTVAAPKAAHKSVTVQEAREEMTDEVAASLIVKVQLFDQKVAKGGKKAIVNIDTISNNFADGDVVDLAALKQKKLVSRKDNAVKVLARGTLDKCLTVVADDFSVDAVKMIVLVGGTAKEL